MLCVRFNHVSLTLTLIIGWGLIFYRTAKTFKEVYFNLILLTIIPLIRIKYFRYYALYSDPSATFRGRSRTFKSWEEGCAPHFLGYCLKLRDYPSNLEVAGSNPGRVGYLASSLCIYSAPNCSKASISWQFGSLLRQFRPPWPLPTGSATDIGICVSRP